MKFFIFIDFNSQEAHEFVIWDLVKDTLNRYQHTIREFLAILEEISIQNDNHVIIMFYIIPA